MKILCLVTNTGKYKGRNLTTGLWLGEPPDFLNPFASAVQGQLGIGLLD